MMRRLLLGFVAAGLLLPAAAFAQDVWPPSQISGFTFYAGHHTMVLNWNAPGDDCETGTATEYELRYSTSTITAGNFASATQISTGTPSSSGTQECANVGGLSASTLYYFAIRSRDEVGNWSPLTFGSQSTAGSGPEHYCP